MVEADLARMTQVVVVVNAALAGAFLVLAGRWLASGRLTAGVPGARQNIGEFVLSYFVRKASEMEHGPGRDRVVRLVAPLLAAFFLFILVSNLVGMVPLPLLGTPPTSYYGVTLSLALCSVIGTLAISAALRGPLATLKHLVWPNPMQWISEFTDVLSLSLRLFGNIAGEFMTVVLVARIVPYGVPLILHALGLIPAFVQALVFTLLTSSFIASAIHREAKRGRTGRSRKEKEAAEAVEPGESGVA
ncbi:MAG: F0F1 ATP synthase subunit A [Actinobacteria bacterium]|nr:MAG: F0F1 ATP synthase subunit A [Actinomycetota bacterium]